jgi:hypothetical protein
MGRKLEGATKRETLVAFRLNEDEQRELAENMAARGIREKSTYYRTLQREDSDRRR